MDVLGQRLSPRRVAGERIASFGSPTEHPDGCAGRTDLQHERQKQGLVIQKRGLAQNAPSRSRLTGEAGSSLCERFHPVPVGMEHRWLIGRVVNGPTLLTGICFCGGCGGATALRTSGKAKHYRYYTCSTAARQSKTGCGGRTTQMDGFDHLRPLAQRVEGAKYEVRIMGSRDELIRVLVSSNGVRTSVPRWRRGWDSNPRGACTPAGFQDRCIRPLCHPSGAWSLTAVL